MARGTPVIASRLGALEELMGDQTAGKLFEPGNAAALARCVREWMDDPTALARMRRAARECYERQFGADRAYAALMRIYEAAMGRARRPGHWMESAEGDVQEVLA
jgi:glycosyltransferase involved in cell wall biosynthesis